MYSYVLYYNIEKSDFSAVSTYLLFEKFVIIPSYSNFLITEKEQGSYQEKKGTTIRN